MKGRFALQSGTGPAESCSAARDRLGAYPLFYAERGDELLLSSGIEDLVSCPPVTTELNRTVLAEHLCSRWPSLEDTYYAAVRRVPPGHLMSFGAGPPRSYRYWDPVPTPDSDSWISEQEVGQFDELFTKRSTAVSTWGPPASSSAGAGLGQRCHSCHRLPPHQTDATAVGPVAGLPASRHERGGGAARGRGCARHPPAAARLRRGRRPAGRVLAAVEGSRIAPTPLWASAACVPALAGRKRAGLRDPH